MSHHSEGLIVTLGSLNSLAGLLFKKDKLTELKEIYIFLKKLFKENFYIEIQRHGDTNEKDLDILMPRTSQRPFATGFFKAKISWIVSFFALLAFSLFIAAY